MKILFAVHARSPERGLQPRAKREDVHPGITQLQQSRQQPSDIDLFHFEGLVQELRSRQGIQSALQFQQQLQHPEERIPRTVEDYWASTGRFWISRLPGPEDIRLVQRHLQEAWGFLLAARQYRLHRRGYPVSRQADQSTVFVRCNYWHDKAPEAVVALVSEESICARRGTRCRFRWHSWREFQKIHQPTQSQYSGSATGIREWIRKERDGPCRRVSGDLFLTLFYILFFNTIFSAFYRHSFINWELSNFDKRTKTHRVVPASV